MIPGTLIKIFAGWGFGVTTLLLGSQGGKRKMSGTKFFINCLDLIEKMPGIEKCYTSNRNKL